jgi:phosphohistidine swiveling domain-containing protein
VTVILVDERKLGMMKQVYYIYLLIKEIARRNNSTFFDVSNLTGEQLDELLLGKKEVLAEGKPNSAGPTLGIFRKEQKPLYFSGQKAEQIFEAALRQNNSLSKVKGSVASTGGKTSVVGIAHVIHDVAKDTFNEGEILVTSMTRIEFVPLMKKAKAIITDEGGIACHAAIVSRELGIPCIIGTKSATRIIKSGDKVELNLVNGEVTLL